MLVGCLQFTPVFGDRGAILGNPDLDPERGFGADAGLTAGFERIGPIEQVGLEAVAFWRETDDLILLVQNSTIADNVADRVR